MRLVLFVALFALFLTPFFGRRLSRLVAAVALALAFGGSAEAGGKKSGYTVVVVSGVGQQPCGCGSFCPCVDANRVAAFSVPQYQPAYSYPQYANPGFRGYPQAVQQSPYYQPQVTCSGGKCYLK
jgi:hypothetical protein